MLSAFFSSQALMAVATCLFNSEFFMQAGGMAPWVSGIRALICGYIDCITFSDWRAQAAIHCGQIHFMATLNPALMLDQR